tara:strand:- start:7098 stop:8231 length:1134 start_codon:yes stop_codon:yes gene_type:complete
MIKTNQFIIASLLIGIYSLSFASQETYEIYTVREKAMGATTVANIKNSHQFNRNSALLSYKKRASLSLPKLSIGLSTDYIDNSDTLERLANANEDLSAQMQDLKSLVPMDFSMNAALSPGLSFTMPYFGLKVYSAAEIAAKLLRKSSPTLYIAGSYATVIQAGISKEFFIKDHNYSFGISPKYIFKNTIYDKTTGNDEARFTQAEILQHINDINEQEVSWYSSSGYSLDLGIATEFTRGYTEGIFGISAKNLISSLKGEKTIQNENQSVSETEPVVVTVGTNMNVQIPKIKKLIIATDYDIVAPTQNAFKRFHLGLEKNLYNFLKLRGGVNQGFIVGGVSLNLYIIKLDYAYFGQELTSTLGNSPLLTHNLMLSLIF